MAATRPILLEPARAATAGGLSARKKRATMQVTFWGTRGSIATPGAETVRFGGNTACVSVKLRAGPLLILDAGTGVRHLGQAAHCETECSFALLLSHGHWDHIQGFPFFAPAYRKGCDIRIIAGPGGTRHLSQILSDQMERDYFPVQFGEMGADIQFDDFEGDWKKIGSGRVRAFPLRHVGGGWGFRIEDEGGVVVYLTDNELPPPGPEFDFYCEACRGADLLIHDAQYLDSELPSHLGWGHSSGPQATRLALQAGCKRLALFHHDPNRTDDAVAALVLDCRALAAAEGSDLDVFAAAEGQMHEIPRAEPLG